jgi:hypothetical protein
VILTGGEAEGSGSPLRVSATQELRHHIPAGWFCVLKSACATGGR